MRAFVTGGTGFVGAEVVRQMRARGDEVTCLVRSPEKATGLTALGCEILAGDLGDAAALAAGAQGRDAVIHVAGMYEVGIPKRQHQAMWEANVAGTERVMRAALDGGVGRVVYVSTVAVFGNTRGRVVDETYRNPEPGSTSYYEKTKFEAHELVARMAAEKGLPAVLVQPGGPVYGPGDTSQFADLLIEFFAGKLPLLPFPRRGLCPSHVEDVAAGILLALEKGAAGESYNLSGPATTTGEVVELAARICGRAGPRGPLPTWLLKAMVPAGPLVGKAMGQPPNLGELISWSDGVTFWNSYEKAAGEFGYAPRGIEEGLRQTLAGDDRLPDPITA